MVLVPDMVVSRWRITFHIVIVWSIKTRAGLATDRVVYIQARENRYSFNVRCEYSEEKIR